MDAPQETRLPTLAETRRAGRPPGKRTGVRTGGGADRYWVCFVRNRFSVRADRLCSAPGQNTRHRDCGWHRFESSTD